MPNITAALKKLQAGMSRTEPQLRRRLHVGKREQGCCTISQQPPRHQQVLTSLEFRSCATSVTSAPGATRRWATCRFARAPAEPLGVGRFACAHHAKLVRCSSVSFNKAQLRL
jgi:hypothetical protein